MRRARACGLASESASIVETLREIDTTVNSMGRHVVWFCCIAAFDAPADFDIKGGSGRIRRSHFE